MRRIWRLAGPALQTIPLPLRKCIWARWAGKGDSADATKLKIVGACLLVPRAPTDGHLFSLLDTQVEVLQDVSGICGLLVAVVRQKDIFELDGQIRCTAQLPLALKRHPVQFFLRVIEILLNSLDRDQILLRFTELEHQPVHLAGQQQAVGERHPHRGVVKFDVQPAHCNAQE